MNRIYMFTKKYYHELLETMKMCVNKGLLLNRNDYYIYPTPPLGQDMTRGQFLSGV